MATPEWRRPDASSGPAGAGPCQRTRSCVLAALALLAFAAVAAVCQAPARPSTATGEWPTYGGDLASTKYSPLDQITAANFASLKVAWRAQSPDGVPEHDDCRTAASGRRTRSAIFDELSRDRSEALARQPAAVRRELQGDAADGRRRAVPQHAARRSAPPSTRGPARTLWVYNPKSYEAGTTTMSAAVEPARRRLLEPTATTSGSTGAPATAT